MEMKHSKERDLENLFVSTWVIVMPHILTASANNHVEEELWAIFVFLAIYMYALSYNALKPKEAKLIYFSQVR